MPYGYFDDAAREYVITTPKTPVKWINYIGTLAFGGFIDQTGGALLCKGDPALNRITKYIPQMPASDFKGTTLYLRLREGNTYRIFSPFFVPTLDRYDLYECHVGLGYTRIVSEFYGIHTEVTLFVLIGGSQELRDIRVTNLRDQPVEIDAIPVVEYTHPDALKQLTMVATEGDSREREDRPHYYGDDHLWAVLAVTAYLKETGDLAFLDAVIPYYEKNRQEQPVESGTVLDHLQRAIEFTTHDLGKHGLPLLGFADWNDTINLAAGAESLFIANQYGKALLEMIDLMAFLGDEAAVARYRDYYDAMRERVNAIAWDGDWYIRYFDFDGSPLGSHVNEQGKIYINGQSWPVISGFATPERAIRSLDAIKHMLDTGAGIKISAPGFDGFDPAKGGVSTYPPGAKENGGIFLHTNPWVIIAETLIGRGEQAYAYYSQINPAARNDQLDEFECEPYVYPQNILGDEHPQFGLARNSWLSGTASWMLQAGMEHILGIRPAYDGLEIDPCIPAAWDGFRVRRQFRGAVYEIQVRNPQHVNKGVKSVIVDGTEIAGNVVPAFDAGLHRVEVVLG